MGSTPLDTPQIGGNEKLDEWMVLDGMGSITFHSILFLQNQTMEHGSIPLHSITLHQSKHSLILKAY